MKHPTPRILYAALIALGVSASPLAAVHAQPSSGPSYEDLQAAEAIVQGLIADVAKYIAEASGGPGTEPERCAEITDKASCEESSLGCRWSEGECIPGPRDENDFLARPVMLAVQSQLNTQSANVIAAKQAFPSPSSTAATKKACADGAAILGLSLDGGVAAAVPNTGHFTPAKFAHVADQENALRSRLKCP